MRDTLNPIREHSRKKLNIFPESGYYHLMNDLTERFKAWMHNEQIKAPFVGSLLDTSPKTINNWRSNGIPARLADRVERLMAEWKTNPRSHLGNSITIRATDEQFSRWNRAANRSHNADGSIKTIEEWALDGLDSLADSLVQHPPLAAVAEDPTDYRITKAGNGGNSSGSSHA